MKLPMKYLKNTCDCTQIHNTCKCTLYMYLRLSLCPGMWPAGADGTDINGCCMNADQTLLASADDFGKVNLYAYPSRTPHVCII